MPEIELCWGNAPAATLDELALAARANGVRALAVRPAMLRAAREAAGGDAAVAERLQSLGVQVTVLDPLITGLPGAPLPEAVSPENRSYFETTAPEAFALAKHYGAGLVNMAHWLCNPKAELAALSHAISGIAAQGREAGVRTAIEFIPGTGVPDIRSAASIVNAVGLGRVGIMFDTWHFARTGGTVEQLRNLMPGAVYGLQISDCTLEAARTPQAPLTGRLAPGEGELPLVEMLRVLLANNRGLRVGIEVFNREQRELPPDLAVARVVEPMRRVLARL
jgi:sugar phosphate isomerase/epimerase